MHDIDHHSYFIDHHAKVEEEWGYSCDQHQGQISIIVLVFMVLVVGMKIIGIIGIGSMILVLIIGWVILVMCRCMTMISTMWLGIGMCIVVFLTTCENNAYMRSTLVLLDMNLVILERNIWVLKKGERWLRHMDISNMSSNSTTTILVNLLKFRHIKIIG